MSDLFASSAFSSASSFSAKELSLPARFALLPMVRVLICAACRICSSLIPLFSRFFLAFS